MNKKFSLYNKIIIIESIFGIFPSSQVVIFFYFNKYTTARIYLATAHFVSEFYEARSTFSQLSIFLQFTFSPLSADIDSRSPFPCHGEAYPSAGNLFSVLFTNNSCAKRKQTQKRDREREFNVDKLKLEDFSLV